MSKMITRSMFICLSLSAVLWGCGEAAQDDNNSSSNNSANNQKSNNNPSGSKKATGAGPCAAASECRGDVCVSIIDGDNPPNYCTQPCDGGCPQGFVCDSQTFSLVGLSFCRFAPKNATPGEEPAPPEEPATLPCKTDKDCEMGTVCASYEGERGCTLPCSVESDCTPPSVGGFSFDLLTCAKDDDQRDVCLPDPKCFPNPTSCVGGFPGL